jgi:hypothetical protein
MTHKKIRRIMAPAIHTMAGSFFHAALFRIFIVAFYLSFAGVSA